MRAYVTFGAYRPRPTIDPSRLQKLPVEDPSTRCSRHPEFASLGTCSRCGTFSCRVCAPFEGFPGRDVCAGCDSLAAVQLERLARARRITALVCLAHLSLFSVTLVVLAALAAPGSFAMIILIALCLGLAGAQFKVNGVWPALLSLPLGLALLVVSTFALSAAKWAPGALLLWPLWFAVGAMLLTLASTQRGQVRAIHASTSKVA